MNTRRSALYHEIIFWLRWRNFESAPGVTVATETQETCQVKACWLSPIQGLTKVQAYLASQPNKMWRLQQAIVIDLANFQSSPDPQSQIPQGDPGISPPRSLVMCVYKQRRLSLGLTGSVNHFGKESCWDRLEPPVTGFLKTVLHEKLNLPEKPSILTSSFWKPGYN